MMAGKLLVEISNPVTQTIDAGKALAKFLGLKEELPEKISLVNGSQLTLSSKKDCYYYTSLNGCSCKAGQYNQICKHRRDLCEATREAAKETKTPKTLLQEMAEQGYEMSFEPDPNYDTAKAKVVESKQQAREYQAKQRMLRNLAKLGHSQPEADEHAKRLSYPPEDSLLDTQVPFKPVLPGE